MQRKPQGLNPREIFYLDQLPTLLFARRLGLQERVELAKKAAKAEELLVGTYGADTSGYLCQMLHRGIFNLRVSERRAEG